MIWPNSNSFLRALNPIFIVPYPEIYIILNIFTKIKERERQLQETIEAANRKQESFRKQSAAQAIRKFGSHLNSFRKKKITKSTYFL